MPLPADPVAWAVDAFRADGRTAVYQQYTRYLDGVQDLAFATPKFDSAFGQLFRALTYNRCESVTGAFADRLMLDTFEADTASVSQAANNLWTENRMDKREGEANAEALAAGDTYAIVWPHPQSGRPVIWPQLAREMRVRYDDEQPGLIVMATKLFRMSDDHLRLNLYLPDRLEKYLSRTAITHGLPTAAAVFERYQPEGDLSWPLVYDWFDPARPSIPVFHFANNARTGQYGRSELRDVIPLQDGINKALADLLLASEFAGFPQKWVSGLKPAIDPATGKAKLPWDVGVDKAIGAEAPDARFGQFEAANLAQLIAVGEAFDLMIARVSKVPVHHLGLAREFPSGEALKTAEAPFVRKVERKQRAFGNVWEDCLALALRMTGVAEPGTIRAIYQPAEPHSDAEQLDRALALKSLGVPLGAILRELGYDDTQIAKIEADAADESARRVEAMRRQFDAGETDLDEAAA